ncbi:PhzF family phenazine biosynthesis isomerase [Ktedonosporobacter rubrisoli]|uniref:PhzF family phenazine biosynthesis isomerase n=1 Tax=Ktedonosporobacter rubrisoli TaxID=2509675 RepID=A0A4P6JLJ6_KTERU|nr:PhzF family phenazine biosynthesis isomerase [Ktedonosporobacter rubrisoli]QBD76074.1 PhzF family phenazine biosynthesis isomerase [Ktedonosporobacter rubrisoli]
MEQFPTIYTRVFEAQPGGGNPAPIVLNASLMKTEHMQELAAHFGVETVFVLNPSTANAATRLRYFVPKHEMEMCVHGTIGAVSALANQHLLTASPVHIETPLGPITVEWQQNSQGSEVTVEQFPATFASHNPSLGEVARVLHIPEEAIHLAWGPIQSVSTSRAKLMVPLRDYHILDSLQPDFEALWQLCDTYQTTGFYPFTLQTREPGLQVEARQFPRRAGFNEDPATGVAACALGAYLTEHEILGKKTPGWHSFTIGQGYAMGRASRLLAEAYVANTTIKLTRIKGSAVILHSAKVELPSL